MTLSFLLWWNCGWKVVWKHKYKHTNENSDKHCLLITNWCLTFSEYKIYEWMTERVEYGLPTHTTNYRSFGRRSHSQSLDTKTKITNNTKNLNINHTRKIPTYVMYKKKQMKLKHVLGPLSSHVYCFNTIRYDRRV